MKLYLVYKHNYSSIDTGTIDDICFYGIYRSEKKARKRAKAALKEAQKDELFIDKDILSKNNPFKKYSCVDLYCRGEQQPNLASSIILKETKLIA